MATKKTLTGPDVQTEKLADHLEALAEGIRNGTPVQRLHTSHRTDPEEITEAEITVRFSVTTDTAAFVPMNLYEA